MLAYMVQLIVEGIPRPQHVGQTINQVRIGWHYAQRRRVALAGQGNSTRSAIVVGPKDHRQIGISHRLRTAGPNLRIRLSPPLKVDVRTYYASTGGREGLDSVNVI